MLLQKPHPIPTRQPRPVTPTTLYSPGRSSVASKSSPVLVDEPWNPLRKASLRHSDIKSSDESSIDSPSSARPSWGSGFSSPASSNTSIYERFTGLNKVINQRIDADIDRISTEIAQSSYLKDGLQQQHGHPSLDEPLSNGQDLTLPVPHMQDVSLALTDPHVLGDPIFMSTTGFEVGPAGLRIGHCSYLNLPPSDCCIMRIIGPTFAGGRPRFQLIIAMTVMNIRTANRSWKLCSIYDVTDMVNEMATNRLTHNLDMQSKEYGQGIAPKYLKRIKNRDGPFDWDAFIEDELTTQDQSPAEWDAKEAHFTTDFLKAPDDIARFIQSAAVIKSRTKKFFILTPRPLEHRKRSMVEVFRRTKTIWAVEIAHLSVSFVSNDLLQETHIVDRLSNHLRRCTADSVTKCFRGGEGFEWRATLRPGFETVINCFPVDNDRDAMAREVWWICFVEA